MLLNHTSGLGKNELDPNKDIPETVKVIQAVGNYNATDPFPLVVPYYKNLNYDTLRVLGYFLTGNPALPKFNDYNKYVGPTFAEHIRKYVLKASGITRTDISWGCGSLGKTRVFAYKHPRMADDKGILNIVSPFGEQQSGSRGLFLSPLEYSQFVTALFKGALLHPNDLKVMTTFVDEKRGAGLERVLSTVFPLSYYGHNGDIYLDAVNKTHPNRTRWLISPEMNFQVVVMSNCCDGLDENDKDLRQWLGSWLDQSSSMQGSP